MGKTANKMWIIVYDDGRRVTITAETKTEAIERAERFTRAKVNKAINVADFIRDVEINAIMED